MSKKGCSTDHFLAEVWDQVTEHLEDSRAASILTSIDYSKAFNRLDHAACLRAFTKKGASNELIRMLACFLSGRTMTVKVGQSNSSPRGVNAGAPQGSVLGTYIFNIGTDNLEDHCNNMPNETTYEINTGDLSFLEVRPLTASSESTPTRDRVHRDLDISPIPQSLNFTILHNARNVPPRLTHRIEPTWKARPITVKKFVDDNLQNEKICMKDVPLYETDGAVYKNARAGKSECLFKHISKQAKQQGLFVNSKKTTLLTISNAVSYNARSHIYDSEQQRIDCEPTLKMLRFIFNQQADVTDQVQTLCKRFRARTWALRHLRKAGLSEQDLVKVYTSTIRPVIEYTAVIYHPMLTAELTGLIEKQQTRALKNIYGNMYSQRRLLELSQLPTLEQRRIDACLRFAQKMSNNPRYQHHFRKRYTRARAGGHQEYLELPARTNRRMNSPLYHYRKILNSERKHYD